jgi:biofilm protein TabA
MIFDNLDNWKSHRSQYGPAVEQALEFILNLNLDEMPDKLDIQGEKMFVMKQHPTTANFEERIAEVHKDYADIHLVMEGEEWQAYALSGGKALNLIEDKLEENDYALYRALEEENRILLTKGMFTVYWPGEYHRPNMHHHQQVKLLKLVVKIHRDLF